MSGNDEDGSGDGASASPRILVAEDDEDSRIALQCLLETYGYGVVAAADGAEAVAMAREHRPDLILMDLKMPVMDGLEAVRRIRDLPTLRDTTIVCVSATREAAALARREDGIDSFLPKPIDPRTLRRDLRLWLDDGPSGVGRAPAWRPPTR